MLCYFIGGPLDGKVKEIERPLSWLDLSQGTYWRVGHRQVYAHGSCRKGHAWLMKLVEHYYPIPDERESRLHADSRIVTDAIRAIRLEEWQ